MKTKFFLLSTALCTSAWIGSTLAQSGGAGGSSGAGASGTSGSSGTAGATGSSSSTSATVGTGTTSGSSLGASGTNSGTSSTSTTPGTIAPTPGTSTRSTADALAPSSTPGRSAAVGSSLPPGLTPAPAQPGVSSLSGLPTAQMPTVSPGTAPIGPQNSTPAVGATPPGDVAHRQGMPTTPNAGTSAPEVNAQIGSGVTTTVPTPPPVANAEMTGPMTLNAAGQAWIPGHYSWTGQWTWVDGNWQRPPNANATWTPGRFDAQSRRWTEGHWEAGAANTAPQTPPNNPSPSR